jgi:integrase
MSVRKRKWSTASGVEKEAWIVAYVDQHGARHIKTFDGKKAAVAYHATVTVEVGEGLHTHHSRSKTVAEAGRLWIETGETNGLERATLDQYRQHLDLHIVPYLGKLKLSELSAPLIRDFEDKLRKGRAAPGQDEGEAQPRSPALTRKIRGSLGSILADAQERGLVARNVVRDLRSRRQRGKERHAERRQNGRLKVGVDLPTRGEIKAMVDAATGRWRPFLLTAIFTGLRASELRGLRWENVDLKRNEIHVRERADRYAAMGRPKSAAGERTVPLPPLVAASLREWRLGYPRPSTGKRDAAGKPVREEHRGTHLVFPNGNGGVENLGNIVNRGVMPVQVAAGVAVPLLDAKGKPARDEEGKPIVKAKYTGLHVFRHFFASWCINRKADGGLELPAKVVQERLGHSSITMTLDTYGHLFPRGDDSGELAAAERALLS